MKDKWDKGYIHLYTGDGKGKTTAAIGLAVRAAYAGKKVYIGQFVKGMKYHEVYMEEDLPNIKIEQYGKDCFIENEPTEEDLKRAEKGLEKISKIMSEGYYDLVVLDELTIALYFKLFSLEDVIVAIENKHPQVELVITGRYAPEELIELADLVTEMKQIKHYYDDQGVMARDGIER